eukprot:TRINITY_DN317_c2_g1_i2.p1 TRINITY_DN317_c2_g1~~TRINITY_DN317_c2_g1_i2.p1  ORF type:complete len:669 (-),score=69.40 TRINITY_DN317_c2_g1_i2:219-2225(-)
MRTATTGNQDFRLYKKLPIPSQHTNAFKVSRRKQQLVFCNVESTTIEQQSLSQNGGIKDVTQKELEQKIQLKQQTTVPSLLLFLPGTDGTSSGLDTHIPDVSRLGWDVRAVYFSPYERPSWQELTTECIDILRKARESYPHICLACESFGACLGLRVALQRPDLVDRLILVNSATAFSRSQVVLPTLFAQSNVLQFFPQQLYDVAQAILVPFIVSPSRLGQVSSEKLRSMMHMEPQLDRDIYINLDRSEGYRNGGGQQSGGGGYYPPAQAGSHRLSLLLEGDLQDAQLAQIQAETLVVCSANDDLLNSMEEGSRLLKIIPNAIRIILPNCNHTPLLDRDFSFGNILQQANFLPPSSPPPFRTWPPQEQLDEEMYNRWESSIRNLLPLRRVLSPVVIGLQNIPSPQTIGTRPIMFVGNHSMYGFLDTFLISLELKLYGIQTSGLAHRGHWLGPLGPFFESYGAVKADPVSVYRALKENKALLVFPGGGKEVNKRKGDQYRLFWDSQPNLVRMAAKSGALVIPFSIVGIDDAYDIYMGPDQILNDQFLGQLSRYVLSQIDPDGELEPSESVAPISYFPGTKIPSLLPVPSFQRLYYKFSEPIDFASNQCNHKDRQDCAKYYKQLQDNVEEGIEELLVLRAQDNNNDLGTRIVNGVKSRLPQFSTILGDLR